MKEEFPEDDREESMSSLKELVKSYMLVMDTLEEAHDRLTGERNDKVEVRNTLWDKVGDDPRVAQITLVCIVAAEYSWVKTIPQDMTGDELAKDLFKNISTEALEETSGDPPKKIFTGVIRILNELANAQFQKLLLTRDEDSEPDPEQLGSIEAQIAKIADVLRASGIPQIIIDSITSAKLGVGDYDYYRKFPGKLAAPNDQSNEDETNVIGELTTIAELTLQIRGMERLERELREHIDRGSEIIAETTDPTSQIRNLRDYLEITTLFVSDSDANPPSSSS